MLLGGCPPSSSASCISMEARDRGEEMTNQEFNDKFGMNSCGKCVHKMIRTIEHAKDLYFSAGRAELFSPYITIVHKDRECQGCARLRASLRIVVVHLLDRLDVRVRC